MMVMVTMVMVCCGTHSHFDRLKFVRQSVAMVVVPDGWVRLSRNERRWLQFEESTGERDERENAYEEAVRQIKARERAHRQLVRLLYRQADRRLRNWSEVATRRAFITYMVRCASNS